jgi:chemotaxis protein CheY-P-specific phosphatase CheC
MKSVKDFNEELVGAFISKVMERAANSFSQIAGMQIQSRSMEVTLAEETSIRLNRARNGQTLCVIVTPLLGGLAGRSYLVLDPAEIDVLLENSPFKPSSGFDTALKEALLKEVDNIVSASVITELANQFKIDLYGDVPELLMISQADFSEMVSQYIPNGQLSLVCAGGFVANDNEKFAPQFIWKFSSAIVKEIEKSLKLL